MDANAFSNSSASFSHKCLPSNTFSGVPDNLPLNEASFCLDPTFAGRVVDRLPAMAFASVNAHRSQFGEQNTLAFKDAVDMIPANGWNGVQGSGLESKPLPAPLPLQFPSDPGFVERAVKFSAFRNNAFERGNSTVSNPLVDSNVVAEPAKSSDDGSAKKRRSRGETAKGEAQESKAKKCRATENLDSEENVRNEEVLEGNPKKERGKNSKPVIVKDDNVIHVRARRGQATDSHSLAERVRREKINERMKYLQELVPTCHKVTGKALMLDEIINYVQSLQNQVEFLSMKLATVNPNLEWSMESFSSREMLEGFQSKEASPAFTAVEHIRSGAVRAMQSPGSDMPSAISSVDSAEVFDGNNYQRQSPAGWDNELHTLYNIGLMQSALQQQHHHHKQI
eukprot:TRINITY_DN8664_c0_g1_i1.p1 TRINITY_DN8664_c0_g1~~TRINITY_DN8664_c0_g1_i1.p1  ORF type:complete len:396 (+),score=74.23 TRINITY_DN8664_c0_g1_i1:821-2008(+)